MCRLHRFLCFIFQFSCCLWVRSLAHGPRRRPSRSLSFDCCLSPLLVPSPSLSARRPPSLSSKSSIAAPSCTVITHARRLSRRPFFACRVCPRLGRPSPRSQSWSFSRHIFPVSRVCSQTRWAWPLVSIIIHLYVSARLLVGHIITPPPRKTN